MIQLIGMIKMTTEKCIMCGQLFEPIPTPIELPNLNLWGQEIKPPHKTICPLCFLSGARDVLDIAIQLCKYQREREYDRNKGGE